MSAKTQSHVSGPYNNFQEPAEAGNVKEKQHDVIGLFRAAASALKMGSVGCPYPRELSQHLLSQRTKSGSGRVCQEMKFSKLRFFYLHAQRRHGIEFSAMMTGVKKCFLSNPSTGRICGMRFDRKDHLVRHQNGADCLSNRGKPETPPHLQGCTFVFDDKRICGKTFKQSKDYTRHLLAKSHGGPGARGHSGGVSQVYIWSIIFQLGKKSS